MPYRDTPLPKNLLVSRSHTSVPSEVQGWVSVLDHAVRLSPSSPILVPDLQPLRLLWGLVRFLPVVLCLLLLLGQCFPIPSCMAILRWPQVDW
jgi:hypothetical protein